MSRIVLSGSVLLLGLLSATAEADPTPSAAADPLAALGATVTGGAAPGYIEDRFCASCHVDLARSFGDVAMSKAFYRPSSWPPIERFGSFLHEPSGRY